MDGPFIDKMMFGPPGGFCLLLQLDVVFGVTTNDMPELTCCKTQVFRPIKPSCETTSKGPVMS